MKLEKTLPGFNFFKSKTPDLRVYKSGDFGLEQYLFENPLNTTLNLDDLGAFSFHWGDWKHSCRFEQGLVHSDKKQTERLTDLKNTLLDLKKQPAWINNKVETVKMSLYDLYKSYQNEDIRKVWFGEEGQKFQVSLSGEIGPYVPIASMRWFNKEIFSCFIFTRILVEKTLNRSFRLGMKSPVVCTMDEEKDSSGNISIHQIMKNGILFRVANIESFNRILVADDVRLEFNTKFFEKLGKAQNGKEFKKIINSEDLNLANYRKKDSYHIDIREAATKYGNLDNYKHSNTKEFFLFVGFEDFNQEGKAKNVGELMNYFMGGAEFVFSKELDKIS